MPEPTVLTAAAEGPPAYLGPAAALVVTAAVIGYLTTRARIVPIVGFLAAGVVIGPAQLGVVDNGSAVQAAADIGIILLLFTIGIEFSLDRLAAVWSWIALGGALQVGLATGAGVAATLLLGGSWQDGVFTGFLLALSSTAIVLKLLGDRREQNGRRGRLALALLIAQDLAVVAMVLVVPILGGEGGAGAGALVRAAVTAVLVVAVVLVVARRVLPPLLEVVARTCAPEVFLLTVVAVCFGTAFVTALAGVSVSLGAFLAGLMVSESRASTQAFAEVMPLQIIFSAVFFVSVGMLLDVGFVVENWALVTGTAVGILLIKTVTTAASVAALRIRARTAWSTGLLLAQVGEFSFVLLTVGTTAGLSPLGRGEDGRQTFVATVVLLMVLTPLLAAVGDRVDRAGRVRARPGDDTAVIETDGDLDDHVAILGWGPTALDLAGTLRTRGVPLVMTTLNPDGAGQAMAAGHTTLRGDPTKAAILNQAGVGRARLVVVAEDEPEQAHRVVSAVRSLTRAPIVVRPRGDADVAVLADAGADSVVDRDRASDHALVLSVLSRLGHSNAHPGADATVVDTTAVVRYPWPADSGCTHGTMSRPVLPMAWGCVECLRQGTSWVHLRICLTCGHVGCCDSSPHRHARAHSGADGHPLITSAEPGETWAYCFSDDVTVDAPHELPRARAMPPA